MWAICLSCHLVSFHHDLATLMKATNMQSTCLWKDICLLSQGNHTLASQVSCILITFWRCPATWQWELFQTSAARCLMHPEARLFSFKLSSRRDFTVTFVTWCLIFHIWAGTAHKEDIKWITPLAHRKALACAGAFTTPTPHSTV